MPHSPVILFIDENAGDREYYTYPLHMSSSDFVVLHAASGVAGLTRCNDQPIDCVILEIDLPDMSGFEILAKLVPRPSHPKIAVIVLTRLPNQFLLEVALKNGAQAAFRKTRALRDILDTTILTAIANVQKDRKQAVA